MALQRFGAEFTAISANAQLPDLASGSVHVFLPSAPVEETRKTRFGYRFLLLAFKAICWAARAYAHHLSYLLSIALLLMSLLYLATKHVWDAPEWMKAQLIEELEIASPGTKIELGSASLAISEGILALRLEVVSLFDKQGAKLLSADELALELDISSALEQKIRPRSLRVSGIALNLSRDERGALALQLGELAENSGTGQFHMGKLVSGFDAAFSLDFSEALKSVHLEGVSLAYHDLRTGRRVVVEEGSASLLRRDDELLLRAESTLLGASDSARLSLSFERRISAPSAQLAVRFSNISATDLASQSNALGWLNALDARLSGSLRFQLRANDGALGQLSATLASQNGAVRPTPASKPIPFSSFRTYLTYTPLSQQIRFDIVEIDSHFASITAFGEAYVEPNVQGGFPGISAYFDFDRLLVHSASLIEQTIGIGDASASFRILLDPFRLELAHVGLKVQGHPARLHGYVEAGEQGWELALNGSVDPLSISEALQLWPDNLISTPRDWLKTRISEGKLTDIFAAVRLSPVQQAPRKMVSFAFDQTSFLLTGDALRIEDASGHATILDDQLSVGLETAQLDGGLAEPIDISGSSLSIADLAQQGAMARLSVSASGRIPSALQALALPPFGISLAAIAPPEQIAEGSFEAHARSSWSVKNPTDKEAFKWNVSALLFDVETSAFLPGSIIAAESLELTAEHLGRLALTGFARVNDMPVSGTWHYPLEPERLQSDGSHFVGTATVDRGGLERLGVVLPPGVIGEGQAEANLSLHLPAQGPPILDVSSDLSGLELALTDLGIVKPPKEAGRFQLQARLAERLSIQKLYVEIEEMEARGSLRISQGGALEEAEFQQLRLGEWFEGRARLTGRGAGRLPELTLLGGILSIPNLPAPSENSASAAGAGGDSQSSIMPARVFLDRVVLSDQYELEEFKAHLAIGEAIEGDFNALIAEGPEIQGQLRAHENGTAFRISTSQVGRAFVALGILSGADGGDAILVVEPTDIPGRYAGAIRAEGVQVTQSPILGGILNALSIVGVGDLLAGKGLFFTEINARFDFDPEEFELYSMHAIGPAIGLTLDGRADILSGAISFQGVVSPVYTFNLLGRIVSSRDGEGLLGFTYRLDGTSDAPKFTLNPLSILVPGALRDMMRR